MLCLNGLAAMVRQKDIARPQVVNTGRVLRLPRSLCPCDQRWWKAARIRGEIKEREGRKKSEEKQS